MYIHVRPSEGPSCHTLGVLGAKTQEGTPDGLSLGLFSK